MSSSIRALPPSQSHRKSHAPDTSRSGASSAAHQPKRATNLVPSSSVPESPVAKLKRTQPSNGTLPSIVASQTGGAYSHTSLLASHRSRLSDMTHDTVFFLDNKLIFGLDPKSEDDCRALILYKKIKGDQLSQLASVLDPNEHAGPEGRDQELVSDDEREDVAAGQDYYAHIVHQALDVYEEALALAEERLTPTDVLKVQLALKASITLYDLSSMHFDALAVAKKCLLKAERYAAISKSGFTPEELEIISMLRDHVSMLETTLSFAVVDPKRTTGRQMANMADIADEENDDKNDSHMASGYIDSLKKRDKHHTNAGVLLSLSHRVEKIKRLSRLDGPKEFMLVGQLNHVQQVMSELNKIFRVYVRGNSLAASTQSGTSVSVDGHKLDIDTFLLNGPYMSWEGFLFFCHDFRITPRRDGKGNRKLNTRAGESYLLHDPFDAQLIFTMTAIAQFPILRISNEEPKEWAHAMRELWKEPSKIAEAAMVPTAGLNFADFVDCLARIALVGFSVGTWAEMFPSSVDRINALFLTQMGMLDNALISANLHQHKQSLTVQSTKFEGMSKLTRQSSHGEGLKLQRQSSYESLSRGNSQKSGGSNNDDSEHVSARRASTSFSADDTRSRRRSTSASAPVMDTLIGV